MKTLFFDFSSGASGDKFLASLIDIGIDLNRLQEQLNKLDVEKFHLHVEKIKRHGLTGTLVRVESKETDFYSSSMHCHRTFKEICQIIERAGFSEKVTSNALSIFRRIAEAEGKIHGIPINEVQFHEIGAIDSIVDILGVCLALEQLNWPIVYGNVLTDGTGTIRCAHGTLPVPVPATLEILAMAKAKLKQCEEPTELLTPTGAAIAVEIVNKFGSMPSMRVEKIGYGFGSRETITIPNVLRAILGEVENQEPLYNSQTDKVLIAETNLDDCNPQLVGYLIERLLDIGALDAWTCPVYMKKNRPAIQLTVLCKLENLKVVLDMIFKETTTFGVRIRESERYILRRERRLIQTAYGEIAVKLGWLGEQLVQAQPEFESCKELALRHNLPLRKVMQEAVERVWKVFSK